MRSERLLDEHPDFFIYWGHSVEGVLCNGFLVTREGFFIPERIGGNRILVEEPDRGDLVVAPSSQGKKVSFVTEETSARAPALRKEKGLKNQERAAQELRLGAQISAEKAGGPECATRAPRPGPRRPNARLPCRRAPPPRPRPPSWRAPRTRSSEDSASSGNLGRRLWLSCAAAPAVSADSAGRSPRRLAEDRRGKSARPTEPSTARPGPTSRRRWLRRSASGEAIWPARG